MATVTKAKEKLVRPEKPGVHVPDGSLALCQAIRERLALHFDDRIPVSAVASWEPEQRQEVIDWLEQFDPDNPPEEPTQPPEWLLRTHQLRMALEPYDSSVEEWAGLVRSGASNSRILSLVATLLQAQGADFAGTDWGPVCWSIDQNRRPSLWFAEEEPPRREPDLASAALAQAVRELYGIPQRSPSLNDHPELRSNPPHGFAQAPGESSDINRRAAAAAAPVETLEIPPELIERFPGNPRDELEFDEAELRELGADLARRQVQACVVRAIPDGRYQLIAGERRWRAARLVDLPALRCEVVDVTDAEAVWMCGAENEQRSDWSAIARARWYRAVKEAEGLTVEQLAAKAGVSQGQVSSCLGLLELPEEWQRRVISREISGTAVRPLIPWAKRRPQVLQQVATELRLPGSGAKHERDAGDNVSVRDMELAVRQSLLNLTRSMNPDQFVSDAPLFDITPARKRLLDCEQLKVYEWTGPVTRAWNTREWDRLQKEAKKEQKAEAGGQGATSRPSPVMSGTSEHGVNCWLSVWAGTLFAERLGENGELALRVLVGTGQLYLVEDHLPSGWPEIRSMTPADFLRLLPAAARASLTEEDWVGNSLSHIGVAAGIAEELGIDLAAEFRPDAELLGHFALEDLRKFAGVGRAQKELPEPELIEHLLANWKAGWLPPLVKKSLGIKAAPRTKARRKLAAGK